jgi:dTDP-glucose pyrophosphorylase
MQSNITKAVLLAAGRGTRMRGLTQELPKPMLEVRGKPILQHIVEGLRDAAVMDLLIVVGWRAEVIQNFFNDGSKLGLRITYATQIVPDGTGRVVELGRDFVGLDPFLLSYGDILVAPENYPRICETLIGTEAVVSVIPNADVSQGGAVFLNPKMEVTDIREKPKPGEPTSPWYNAGIYAFRSSIFDYTAKLKRSPRGEFELTDAIRALAHNTKKVQAIALTGNWADVRDPEILAQLNR